MPSPAEISRVITSHRLHALSHMQARTRGPPTPETPSDRALQAGSGAREVPRLETGMPAAGGKEYSAGFPSPYTKNGVGVSYGLKSPGSGADDYAREEHLQGMHGVAMSRRTSPVNVPLDRQRIRDRAAARSTDTEVWEGGGKELREEVGHANGDALDHAQVIFSLVLLFSCARRSCSLVRAHEFSCSRALS